MSEEKRMAENYEIISAFRIGDKEVVFGLDERSDKPYFCALYEKEAVLCYTRGTVIFAHSSRTFWHCAWIRSAYSSIMAI